MEAAHVSHHLGKTVTSSKDKKLAEKVLEPQTPTF